MSTLKTNRIENLTTTDGGISINNSGNVGVANSSPTTGRLVVGSTSDSSTNVNITSSTSGTGLLSFSDTNSGQGGIRYFHSTDHMQFHTADNDRMRIDSSGRLLIGTSTAGSGQLTVASTAHTGITIRSGNASTNSNIIFADAASGGDYGVIQYKHSDDSLRFTVNNAERFRIDSSGRIGLGGAPDAWDTDSGLQAIQLHGYGALWNYYNNVQLAFNTYQSSGGDKYLTTDEASKYTLDGAGNHIWYTAPSGSADAAITFSERMRIDSSGRLLVGSSSTVDSSSTALLQTSASGGARLALGNPNTVGAGAAMMGQIGFYGYQGAYALSASIAAHASATWSTNDYPTRLSFSTTADGASSPSERMRIQSGGGVSIGTTSSPTCLTQASALRLGNNTLGSHAFTNVSTTVTNITAASGLGGLAFVQAYNTANGAQYVGLLMWRYGHVVTISENNNTGLTLNFSVSTNTLRLATSSGTVSGSVITLQAST